MISILLENKHSRPVFSVRRNAGILVCSKSCIMDWRPDSTVSQFLYGLRVSCAFVSALVKEFFADCESNDASSLDWVDHLLQSLAGHQTNSEAIRATRYIEGPPERHWQGLFACNELFNLPVVSLLEWPWQFMLVSLLSIDLRDTFCLQLSTDLSIADPEVNYFDRLLGGLDKARLHQILNSFN